MQGIRVLPQNTHMTADHPTLPKIHTHMHTFTKTHLLNHFLARECLLQLALEVAYIHDVIEESHCLDLGHVLEENIQTRSFVPLHEVDLSRVHSIVGPNYSIHAHACTHQYQHNQTTPCHTPSRCMECE